MGEGGNQRLDDAAGVEDGRLLRAISKGGKVKERMSGWSVWSVVEQCAKEIGIDDSEPMTCGRCARSSVGRAVVIWNKSSSCWDTARSKPRNAILALSRSSSRRSTIRWDSERSAEGENPFRATGDRLRPLRYGGRFLFQMGLEHPKSRHRQLSVFVRQFQEFVQPSRC
jgi:hypothetical protein